MHNDIQMGNVTSSNVAAVGYDQETKTLRVGYLSGAMYDYFGVPLEVFVEMQQPGVSIGTFIASNIKRSYSCAPVQAEATQDE